MGVNAKPEFIKVKHLAAVYSHISLESSRFSAFDFLLLAFNTHVSIY